MLLKSIRPTLCALAILTAFATPIYAETQQSNAPTTEATASTDANSARQAQMEQILQHLIEGPQTIPLGAEGELKLAKGLAFLPKNEANKMMELWGNRSLPSRYGLILPQGENDNWFADLTYDAVGYIKDDDAKEWDTEAMLTSLKEGNEEQNKVRQSQGLPEIETHGWIEKPQYDATTHRLIWSIDAYEKGKKDDNPSVNYNAFLLGRKGYINLTLVTDLKEIETLKPVAKEMLASIEFKEGQRYADFNEATDTVAEYGLAALVGGVAAKKLGLFAMIGALLAKFGKFIVIGGIAAFALLKKVFKRDE